MIMCIASFWSLSNVFALFEPSPIPFKYVQAHIVAGQTFYNIRPNSAARPTTALPATALLAPPVYAAGVELVEDDGDVVLLVEVDDALTLTKLAHVSLNSNVSLSFLVTPDSETIPSGVASVDDNR